MSDNLDALIRLDMLERLEKLIRYDSRIEALLNKNITPNRIIELLEILAEHSVEILEDVELIKYWQDLTKARRKEKQKSTKKQETLQNQARLTKRKQAKPRQKVRIRPNKKYKYRNRNKQQIKIGG